ncbi:carbon-nitrogen hydrolase family protein [Phaeovulum sp.]|uniref:carbon-nitrogen hydrolase family protein n=1 Tax=Phaeovulum sp. TaxID=2934796 RepID=UPI0035660263
MTKIAIVQEPPVFLNRERTIAKAAQKVEEAAARGAQLIVFNEAFVPGYPAWIWRLKPSGDWGLSEALHAKLVANAVDLTSDQLQPLCDAAAKAGATVTCGINERDSEVSGTTLYNTLITIGPDGALLNRHRKLMPTNPERMVWGFGDASGLRAVKTPIGRVGGLICWENFMPLARYALYGQGLEVLVAPTNDSGDGWIGSLQHIAREGRCWVLGAGNVLRVSDLPADFPDKERLYPDAEEWMNGGDSVVIAPGGEIVAGPMRKEVGLLEADIDLDRIVKSRRPFDVAGHYSRPDIFTLEVNNRPQRSVVFKAAQ